MREYLDAFIVAGLVALFLITFVVRAYFIPSESMVPTLQVHDVLLVDQFQFRFHGPHNGDIVVFKPPVPATNDFIKRVIAVPGDTLRVQDGTVYVNGKAVSEPYISSPPDYNLVVKNFGIAVGARGEPLVPLSPDKADIPPRSMWQAPDRVPNGFYFMMGDNRNVSDDSHIWGFAQLHGTFVAGQLAHVASAEFTGRAFLLFWPLRRLRTL
ncbi:MAG: signal peptidase I [Candidatus Eremiobacteraeota bacterium]|nr:signal peptidase I [Candidatus Eremiobacteraeota bacterium]